MVCQGKVQEAQSWKNSVGVAPLTICSWLVFEQVSCNIELHICLGQGWAFCIAIYRECNILHHLEISRYSNIQKILWYFNDILPCMIMDNFDPSWTCKQLKLVNLVVYWHVSMVSSKTNPINRPFCRKNFNIHAILSQKFQHTRHFVAKISTNAPFCRKNFNIRAILSRKFQHMRHFLPTPFCPYPTWVLPQNRRAYATDGTGTPLSDIFF